MSGGVDSAVAALLRARTRRRSSRSRSSCGRTRPTTPSAPAARPPRSACARSLAHDMGLPHFTLDLREEFRAGVVEPWLAGHAAGVTPNPCVRCNGSVRLDAMVAFADRLGAASLATGHYARRRRRAPAARRGPRQGPDLHARRDAAPSTLARLRFPLGDLKSARSARSPPAPGCRSPTSPTPRTSASSRGRPGPRSSPGTARCRTARATSSTATASSSAATGASTTSPSASAAAWASRRGSRAMCSARTRTATR